MNSFPPDWFAKLSVVKDRPDLLSGVEAMTVVNLSHTRGAPNAADAAMVERVFEQITKETADGREA